MNKNASEMELIVKSNEGDSGNMDSIDAMDLIGCTMKRQRRTRKMMAIDGEDTDSEGDRREG